MERSPRRLLNAVQFCRFSVEAAVSAAKTIDSQAARLPDKPRQARLLYLRQFKPSSSEKPIHLSLTRLDITPRVERQRRPG
jgi:hypothetical protein